MVLHADGDQTYAVSFPRDLWVNVPGKGMAKINAAYNDGPQKVVDMLKADFNIDINHYLEVNFIAFERLVDAIGTVGVYFPAPTRDYDTAQQGDTGFLVDTPGCVQLTGDRALQYVRARHMQQLDPTTGKWASVDPIPDIARIERQQSFVRKLGTVAVHRLFADPLLTFDVRDGVVPTLTADPSFDRAAFDQLVRSFLAVSKNPDALQFDTLPWTDGARQAGQQVLYVKKPDADVVLARLRGEAPIPTPARSRRRHHARCDRGTRAPARRRAGEGAERLGRAERRRQRPERAGADRLRQRRGRQRHPRRDRQDRDPLQAGRRGQGPARRGPRAGRDARGRRHPPGHRRGPGARTRLQGHRGRRGLGDHDDRSRGRSCGRLRVTPGSRGARRPTAP